MQLHMYTYTFTFEYSHICRCNIDRQMHDVYAYTFRPDLVIFPIPALLPIIRGDCYNTKEDEFKLQNKFDVFLS